MKNADTFEHFTQSLGDEIGISQEAATKVVNWLIAEGVLDMPVLQETFNGVSE